MLEPGLDKHEWVSVWQSLEEDLETSPAETLPELDRLVERRRLRQPPGESVLARARSE